MFPFNAEVLASLYAQYNTAIWPAQVLALAAALIAVWLTLSPQPWSGRALGAILALGWLWCGAAFFLRHMASLDFMAQIYGWAFIAEAVLLLWALVWRGGTLHAAGGRLGGLALALAAASLFGLPLVSGLAGPGFAAAGVVGVAPAPTVLLTLAVLLLMPGRTRWLLLVIPALWAAVAGVTGWVLGVPEYLALAGLSVAAVAGMAAGNWRAA
ncbi:DUF6064 family protein [Pelagibius sp. 7325]|uniref:DUF6064 family protein n=1 Tax=Pelagibius sp. 7325 TaxID=3131994 RepID=UPI0030EFA1E0